MITKIFGVNIYVDKVKDKSKIDDVLSDIDLKTLTRPSDHWNCDCFTGHSHELINLEESWVQVFGNSILPNIQEYINSLIGDQKIDYEMAMQPPWINVYEKNNYQEMHSHVGLAQNTSLFSYAYIHKLPDSSGSFTFQNVNTTQIYIGQQHCEKLIPTAAEARWVPNVEEGTIIVFPSWLEHYVTPNRSEEQRITISGNIKRIK